MDRYEGQYELYSVTTSAEFAVRPTPVRGILTQLKGGPAMRLNLGTA